MSLKYIKVFSWLWLSGIVASLDQLTKWLVVTHIAPYETTPVFSFLNFTLIFNRGAAFSLLSSGGGWQRWFFIAVALVICALLIVWLKRIQCHEKFTALGFSLIIGGAIGNLLDRLNYGYVIDFIDFHLGQWHWYTFNIADIAISLGVAALFIDLILNKKNQTASVKDFWSYNAIENNLTEQGGFEEKFAHGMREEEFRGSDSRRNLQAAQQNLANQGHKNLGVKAPDLIDEFPAEDITKDSNLSEGPQNKQQAEVHPITGKSARFHNSDENTAPLPDSPDSQPEFQNRYTPSPGNQPGAAPKQRTAPDFKPPGM